MFMNPRIPTKARYVMRGLVQRRLSLCAPNQFYAVLGFHV